ncbi:hypothetical protein HMPREF9098_1350 [Kingella denitrificans ATCC 33394]|uniref:Uncharacterized protein n=1 Tax=Kingella denitrificans ATCC 33394 TaxID=888741 RepID=F0EZL3_9NEIS|nr:hypothetical protein HMPREF9098_1350 [Kingella denitrificans ATCC 33394]
MIVIALHRQRIPSCQKQPAPLGSPSKVQAAFLSRGYFNCKCGNAK